MRTKLLGPDAAEIYRKRKTIIGTGPSTTGRRKKSAPPTHVDPFGYLSRFSWVPSFLGSS
jgi:hypothetical protein